MILAGVEKVGNIWTTSSSTCAYPPRFTRGAWKTAKPVSIGAVDLDKMGIQGVWYAERDSTELMR